MSRDVGEKNAEKIIFSILSSKGAWLLQKLTTIDDTWTWSEAY